MASEFQHAAFLTNLLLTESLECHREFVMDLLMLWYSHICFVSEFDSFLSSAPGGSRPREEYAVVSPVLVDMWRCVPAVVA